MAGVAQIKRTCTCTMDLCTEYIRRYPYFVSTSQWYSATKWTNHGQQSRVEAVFRHQPVPIRIKNVFALPCDAEFDYTPTYSYSLSLDKTDILEFLLTFLLPWSGELFASFFFPRLYPPHYSPFHHINISSPLVQKDVLLLTSFTAHHDQLSTKHLPIHRITFHRHLSQHFVHPTNLRA